MRITFVRLRRSRWVGAAAMTAVCFGMAWALRLAPDSQPPQDGAVVSVEPLHAPQQPLRCNNFREYVDEAILRWHELKGTHLIIILRPGEGEKTGQLSRTRLRKVESYLAQRYNGEIVYVTAEGSRVKGLGRVELYVGGKLLAALPLEKDAETVCLGKVNPFL